MATQIFTGAWRALQASAAGTQSAMYQQHFRSAPTRRSVAGNLLRRTTHIVTDQNGTRHRLTVISTQRDGQAASDVLVMNPADAASAANYVRTFSRGRRQ